MNYNPWAPKPKPKKPAPVPWWKNTITGALAHPAVISDSAVRDRKK